MTCGTNGTTLTITRGSTRTIPVRVSQDGQPIDLAGTTLLFTVKQTVDESADDSTALIAKSATGNSSGEATFTLTSDDTSIEPGDYVWGLRMVTGATVQDPVAVGRVLIIGVVTNRRA